MAAGEKTLKIAVAVDGPSIQKAKFLIDGVTRSVVALIAASNRAGGLLSAGGGGGVSGQVLSPGSGGATHLGQTRAYDGRQLGSGVASILGGSPQSIQALSTATQNAFTAVGAKLNVFVSNATAQVGKLQQAIAGINATLGQPGGNAGATAPGAAGPQGAPPAPPPRPPRGGQPTPPGGFWGPQGFNGWLGGRVQAMAQSAGLPPASAAYLGRTASGPVGAIGVGFAAGLNIGERFNKSFEETYGGQVQYERNEPLKQFSRRAAMMAPFRSMQQSALNRDASGMLAWQDTLGNKQMMKLIGNTKLNDASVQLMMEQFSLGGVKKDLMAKLKNAASMGVGAVNEVVFNEHLPEATSMNLRQIANQTAIRNLGPEQAAKVQQLQQDIQATQSPMVQRQLGETYGNAMGRVSAMRSLGMSTGLNRAGTMSKYEEVEARLMKGGWSFGDAASNRSQLLGVGLGYGAAGAGGTSLVSAGIGGLSNAAELYRAGGMTGGSVQAGGSFYRQVQASVGQRGLDVAVGRDFFGGAMQSMQGTGQFGDRGSSAAYAAGMAGLLRGQYGQLDVAQQQGRMALMQAGDPMTASLSKGTLAPLYQATGLLGAISASGGYGAGAEALTRMDPRLIATIARGGAIPTEYAGEVSQQSAQKFQKDYLNKGAFFEVQDSMFKGKEQKDFLRNLRAEGGDVTSMIFSQTAGLKGVARDKEITRLERVGGGILEMSGIASSSAAGAGTIQNLMFGAGYGKALKAGGVGAAAPRGGEGEALSKQTEVVTELGKLGPAIERLITILKPKDLLETGKAGQSAVGSAGNDNDVDGGVQVLKDALDNFARIVRRREGAASTVQRVTTGKK